MSSEHTADIDHLVVVPHDAGPLVPLTHIDRPRGEVDQVLDEMFGDVDDEGPGFTDAALLTGGTIAVVAAQVAALPAVVLIGGLAGLGLGSVIPIRSGFRRLQTKRRGARIEALIGQGHLLDTRHALVGGLVASYHQALSAADKLAPAQRIRTRGTAHALLAEVATLLDGHRLSTDVEIDYASQRLNALNQLNEALRDVDADRSPDERRSQVRARQTIEELTGESALQHAQELTDDLAINRDV